MKWIWTLFLASTCFGQLTTQSMQPFFNGTRSSNVTNFTSAEFVWISSDLTTNVAVSGNWNDRIQNLALLEGAAARQPTNSSQGIWFDSTHWLTNFMTGAQMGSNVSFGMIIKIIDPTGGSAIMPGFSGNDFSGADGGGRIDLRFNSGSVYEMAYTLGQASPQIIGPAGLWSTTNVVFDFVYSQIMTNNGTGGFHTYTNGLSMLSGTLNGTQVAAKDYFGSTAPQNSADSSLRVLFRNQSRASSAKLFCLEYWIWTNSAPGAANGSDIDPSVLAAFHTRAKTYYGVSP